MANRRRRVEPGDPLAEFAAKLRALQAGAMARARTPQEVEDLKIDKVAASEKWRCGASTIYAALSGARLPSIQTLRAMVEAWDPRGANGFPAWWKERDATQDKIIARRAAAVQGSSLSSAKQTPSAGRMVGDADALAELRRQLTNALAAARLNKTQLAARTGLGRTTVSEAFSPHGALPSAQTVAALCDALHLSRLQMLELLRVAQDGRP